MPKKKLTQARLKELLHYDPETGVWRRNRKYISRGRKSLIYLQIAGCINKHNDYRYIRVDDIPYGSSRLAHLYMVGYFPEYQMDHINRIRNDDRWCNLRHVSASCNNKNMGIRSTNTSGITGVYFHKRKNTWTVAIHSNGKKFNFNCCKNFNDAVKIRWEAEKKYNYPNCNSTSSAYIYLSKHGLI